MEIGEKDKESMEQETKEEENVAAPEQQLSLARRLPWPMLVVAAVFVVVAFMSWYGSWFGRPLSDAQIESYLNDEQKPRNAQHALTHIQLRMEQKDESIKRWYPGVIKAATHPTPQVRLTAAWVMGQDNTQEEFHSVLRTLLKDDNAGVRHNAALSLVRFNDAAGRPELVAMLESKTVVAEKSGVAELIVNDEEIQVAPGSPLIRIKQDDGQEFAIHAQNEARVERLKVSDDTRVEEGTELLVLAPATEQAWAALRALYIVGEPEDIRFVERYTRPFAGLPERIQKQAIATIEAIRARSQRAGGG